MRGVPDGSVFADSQDAFFAVRSENKGKNFRYRVVEFSAGIGCFERTIGTRTELLVDVAGANVTPVFPLNLLAAWAFSFLVFSAGTAIQAAISNQLRIVFYIGVHFTST